MKPLRLGRGLPTGQGLVDAWLGWGWLLGVLLVGTVAAAEASGTRLRGSRPNVVVVLTDDQGYGEISAHGNPILRTPHLDRLHAASLRFTRFHVSPTCAPTRAALLTGRHEFRSGVTHTIFERERLSLDAVTLPSLLRDAGYATGIFGKWHLGDEDDHQPGRRGFDEVFIHGGGGIGQTYPGSCGDAPGNTYRDPWIRHNGRFEKTQGYCTDVFFRAAQEWIRRQDGARRPFLAWIAPNVPHDPFITPGPEWEAPYRDRGLSTNAVRYYAMIAHLDAALGGFLDALKADGLAERTLVIFLTDNGHSVGGVFNAGMRAQKGTPYEGGIRVPSFWCWPGRLPSGQDCDRLTAHLDLLPTLLELAGRAPPTGLPLEGRSLVPLLENPGAPWPNRYLFTHLGRWEHGTGRSAAYRQSAVMDERFKLVNGVELYDLLADPAESRNLLATHPAEAVRLRKAYDDWWKDILPSALRNEDALGPYLNPFKAAFWEQNGGQPDAALRDRMNPVWKFDSQRPRF